MKKELFSWIVVLVLFSSIASAAGPWVKDHNNCPQVYQSQDCTPDLVCGYTGGVTYCDDPATINSAIPGTTTTETDLYDGGLSGGYVLDCTRSGTSCLPWACQRDSSCYSVNRITQCNGGATTFSCTTCRTGYTYCDGSYTDGDGCEIRYGQSYSNCIGNDAGDNNYLTQTCVCTCDVTGGYTWLACNSGGDKNDADGCEIHSHDDSYSYPGVANARYADDCASWECITNNFNCDAAGGNGCEITNGESCTVYSNGGSGTCGGCGSTGYDSEANDCACTQLPPVTFETGVLASYTTSQPLLWGHQLGTGALLNISNRLNQSLAIDNETCIVFNDGTKTCSGTSGGGGVWAEDGNDIYNTNTGNVGIGTTNPLGKLHLAVGEGLYFTSDYNYYDTNEDARIIRMVDVNGNNGGVDGGITFERYTSTDNISHDVLTMRGNGNIGIETIDPVVSLHINSTDALIIPVGTNSQKPGTPQAGMIRYNSELSTFEGYGTAWGSLGGVMDVDQDTYIVPEVSAGSDEDDLMFYTLGTQKMVIQDDGDVGIGISNPDAPLYVNGGNNNPQMKIVGGGSIGEQTHLLMVDGGTATSNIIDIDFAHTSEQPNARIRSIIQGSSAVNGADLVLETASDDGGTWNTDQLRLDNGGGISINGGSSGDGGGNGFTVDSSGNVYFDGFLYFPGEVYVVSYQQINGSIYPSLDDTFNLGTTDKNWEDAYISGNLYDGSANSFFDNPCSNGASSVYAISSDGGISCHDTEEETHASEHAGNGLGYSGDTLNVGAGSCITIGADNVGVTSNCVDSATVDSLDSSQFLRSDSSDTMDAGTSTTLTILSDDAGISTLNLYGPDQGTGRVYVGQSTSHGGGIIYDGNNIPSSVGTTDHISIFRRTSSVDTEVLHWAHDSNTALFEGNIDANSNNIIDIGNLYTDDSSTNFFSGSCGDNQHITGISSAGTISCAADSGDIAGVTVSSGEGTKGGGSASSGSFSTTIEFDCSEVAGNQLTCSGEDLQVSEGSGSGLDADLLDGQSGSYYKQNLNNVLTTGNDAGNLEIVNVNGIRFGSASSPGSWQIYLSGTGYVTDYLRADGGLTTDSTDPGTGNIRASGDLTVVGNDLFDSGGDTFFEGACSDNQHITGISSAGAISCAADSGDIAGVTVSSGEGTKGGGSASSGSFSTTIEFDCSEVAGTHLACSGEDLYVSTDFEEEGVSCTDCINAEEIEDIYVFNSGDGMTGNLDMNDHDILDVNTVQANTILDPEDDWVYIQDNLQLQENSFNLGGSLIASSNSGRALSFLGTSADDTNYEYIGFNSGATRKAIMVWDGDWDSCASNTGFCFKAEDDMQLRLKSENGDVAIYDGLTVNDDLTVSGGDITIGKSGTDSYLNFNAASGGNDPGWIKHTESPSNTGIIHIAPSDDNSYDDYVAIHGTNDPETIKIHTTGDISGAGTITASNFECSGCIDSGDLDTNYEEETHCTDHDGAHLTCSGDELQVSDDWVDETGDTMTGDLTLLYNSWGGGFQTGPDTDHMLRMGAGGSWAGISAGDSGMRDDIKIDHDTGDVEIGDVYFEKSTEDTGFGTTDPTHKVHAVDSTAGDDAAVYGEHAVTDYYGIGVEGKGGYKGVVGTVAPTGSGVYRGVEAYVSGGSGTNYGVYATAYGSGTNYGIRATASGGSENWAGYFSGNVQIYGDSHFRGVCYYWDGGWQTGSLGNCRGVTYDLAEHISVPKEELLSAGDIVITGDGNTLARKSKTPFDDKVIGVYSTGAAITFEEDQMIYQKRTYADFPDNMHNGTIPLAVAGRVPVKVTDENGEVQIGDRLTTSSTPGFAMKFTLLDPNDAETFEELKQITAENERRRGSVFGKVLALNTVELQIEDKSGIAEANGWKTSSVMTHLTT